MILHIEVEEPLAAVAFLELVDQVVDLVARPFAARYSCCQGMSPRVAGRSLSYESDRGESLQARVGSLDIAARRYGEGEQAH